MQPSNEKELQEVINRAFDYRGDVTIHLKTGEQLIGYVFDRRGDVHQPYVKVFLPNRNVPHCIFYHEIAGVTFSGEDMAFGRSWEDWTQKWKKPELSS